MNRQTLAPDRFRLSDDQGHQVVQTRFGDAVAGRVDEFIRKTATRIIRFEKKKLVTYEGGWEEMEKPAVKDTSAEDRKLAISRLEMEMAVLTARMSAPRKGDRPEELQAEFMRLAEEIRALKSGN